MGKMMNTKRCCRDKNYGIDRISILPDDVLTHILSFLSTKMTVQTCILSKRWKNIWTYVPVLEFNIKEFRLPEIVYDEMAVVFVTKFELLVKSVLEKRERCCVINRFQFWLDYGGYWPHTQAVADYICDAMKLEPRECSVKLDLCANLNLNIDMIFTCTSLIDLQLHLYIKDGPFVAIEPNSIKLPCLKTLDLTGDITISDDFFKKLFLGCPALEELVLSCSMGIIEICSNTLRKLVIRSFYDRNKLQISMPNLMCFEIHILHMAEIFPLLPNMPFVVDAFISVPFWYYRDEYITGVPKLIANFPKLENLKLQFHCADKKVIKNEFSNCPVFNNLKHLELVSLGFCVFDLAVVFLHHSPKLQELTLKNINKAYLYDETALEGPGDALVQREFLKTVRIGGFKNDNGFVDRLINKLFAHVKIIGEIISATANEAALQVQSLCPPLTNNPLPPQQSLQAPQQYPQQSSQVVPSYNQTIYGYQGGVVDPSMWFVSGSETSHWRIMPSTQVGFVQEKPVIWGGLNQGTMQPISARPTTQQFLSLPPQQFYQQQWMNPGFQQQTYYGLGAIMRFSWDQGAPFARIQPPSQYGASGQLQFGQQQQPHGYGAPSPYRQNVGPPQQPLRAPPPQQFYGQQVTQSGFQQYTYSAMHPQWQLPDCTYKTSIAAQHHSLYSVGQYGQAYNKSARVDGYRYPQQYLEQYSHDAPGYSQTSCAYNHTIYGYQGDVTDLSTYFNAGANYWQMMSGYSRWAHNSGQWPK